MKPLYSIIIPIFNEVEYIPKLLDGLKEFSIQGHEILIINDGSNDGSEKILSSCNFIKVIHSKVNMGKGYSLKKGLQNSENQNIIIFDGDLELNLKNISKLMYLAPEKGINFILGNRFNDGYNYTTIWDFGNYILTSVFNFLYRANIKDLLCCAKSFNKNDIDFEDIKSIKFDVDLEISYMLLKKHMNNFSQIDIDYSRRKILDGKKLRFSDTLKIIKRILSFKMRDI